VRGKPASPVLRGGRRSNAPPLPDRVIRMSKLRIKVSGCMRSMKGAQVFCAIRTYLATAARHGIGWLDALTQAAAGTPWIPETG
jgi:transposase